MKTSVIKCKKCGKEFKGKSFSDVERIYGLKKSGKYYVCDCKDSMKSFSEKIGMKKD